jgi:hypothetical protein
MRTLPAWSKMGVALLHGNHAAAEDPVHERFPRVAIEARQLNGDSSLVARELKHNKDIFGCARTSTDRA